MCVCVCVCVCVYVCVCLLEAKGQETVQNSARNPKRRFFYKILTAFYLLMEKDKK